MKNIIEKLETEKSELSEKIDKLNEFIMSEGFNNISFTQQELLGDQFEAMSLYKSILEKRIKDLN